MNWRRGAFFATIHLVLAVSLLVWQESKFWCLISTDRNHPVEFINTDLTTSMAIGEQYNPCEGWIWDGPTPPHELIIAFADLPAEAITGGHEPCNTPTRLDRLVRGWFGKTRNSETGILAIFVLTIAVQWFLLGAFPLIHPKRWWLEPGALVTACTVPVACLAFIPEYLFPPATYIIVAIFLVVWTYWLGLIVWRLFRGVQLLVRRRPLLPSE
jgi:hypothetical protein